MYLYLSPQYIKTLKRETTGLCDRYLTLVETTREAVERLTQEQRGIFDEIIEAINNDEQIIGFINSRGGCGKTFLMESPTEAR